MMERYRTLIIVPAYNEEEAILGVITGIRSYSPVVDILVVNDGSVDSTEQAVRKRIEEDKGVYLVNLPFNLGIGAAIQTGFKFAWKNRYDACVQCDGDGQHPPYQINSLLESVLMNGSDVAIGSRFNSKYSYKSTPARLIGIYILSKLISFIVGQSITDPTIGFRAFNRRAIKFFSEIYPQDYPEPESLILAWRKGLKIKEIPIRVKKRESGISSIGVFGSCYYMVKVFIAIFIDLFEEMP